MLTSPQLKPQCICCHQCCKINVVEQRSFDQLAACNWAFNPEKWLSWKNNRTFWNRSNLQFFHIHVPQVINKVVILAWQVRLDIFKLFFCEFVTLNEIDALFEATEYSEWSLEWLLAIEQIKARCFILTPFVKIAKGYSELVKICQSSRHFNKNWKTLFNQKISQTFSNIDICVFDFTKKRKFQIF